MPQSGDKALISAGHTVVFDTNAVVSGVDVSGKLDFSRTVSTTLETSDNVVVQSGGELIVGLSEDPIPSNIVARIVFDVDTNDDWVGGSDFASSDTGLWVMDGGRWESHGSPIYIPWTELAADASAGSTEVVAEGALVDWPVGATVLVTATGRNISTAYGVNDYFTEDEERGIAAVQDLGDGTSRITLDAPLAYGHSGSGVTNGEIGLLSRNVVVSASNSARAHTVYMHGSSGTASDTLFLHLGPTVSNRHPVHFYAMAETSIGKVFRGNVIWDSLNRFVMIHNSVGIELTDNIGYRAIKGGFKLEDSGSGINGPKPMDNIFIHNLAVKITGLDRNDRRLAAFQSQRENHFLGNTAVSIGGNGDSSGFHWPEAHIQSSGQVFVQNESHSNLIHGMFGWQNNGAFHIVEPSVWRNSSSGIKWGAYVNSVQFHGLNSVGNVDANFRARNNHPQIFDSYFSGEASYPTNNGLFIDFYTLPPSPDDPGRTYGSVLENHVVADVNHLPKTTCANDDDCIPTFNAIVGTQLLSSTPIRFGTDWETRNPFFDVRDWQGTGDGLPLSFRVSRPDQPKPSPSAFYHAPFDAWVDPENSTAAARPLPPTISWTSTPSSVGSGPVTFRASAADFTTNEGEIEFFVDEMEQASPWRAEYYSNPNLAGSPVVVTEKPELDFFLGIEPENRDLSLKSTKNLSPYLTLTPKGSWSGRFTRDFTLDVGGEFEFFVLANDGVRFYLDGALLVDSWREHSTCCTSESTRLVNLSAGPHQIVTEFFTSTNDRAKLTVEMHRILSGSSFADSFTFDPSLWKNRRQIRVYARAHDPATEFYAYTPVLTFDNPNFDISAPETAPPSPDATPTPVPQATATPVPQATATLVPVPGGERVSDGLIALYEFEEGAGSSVADSSGVGTPLELTVQNVASVTWVAGGIRVDGDTSIGSSVAAAKISDAVKANSEITVEAWITPADLAQTGPARIMTISGDSMNRNVTLGQSDSSYNVRFRSADTDLNGLPPLDSPAGAVAQALQHVVFTRDSAGNTTLYVDGVPVQTGVASGDLNSWDAAYVLTLANEIGGGRTWLGDFHLVAIYAKDLSQAEVSHNFSLGKDATAVPPAPTPTPIPEPVPTDTPEPTPTNTPEPVGPVPGLVLSDVNRTSALPLDGATVSGDIFVRISNDTEINTVIFFLDDPDRTGEAFRTELGDPYDFAGGPQATANPFDTTQLADGSHTIGAVLTSFAGDVEVLIGMFTVDNFVAPPPTETPVPQPTETPVPQATETPVPQPTDTPVPQATSTPVPQPTATPIPVVNAPPPPSSGGGGGGGAPAPTPTQAPSGPVAPEAPRSVTAIVDGLDIVLEVSAPLVTGGSPITGYRVLSSPDATIYFIDRFTDGDTLTISGLSIGVDYQFQVRAINAAGMSPSGTMSNTATITEVVSEPTPTPVVVGAPSDGPEPTAVPTPIVASSPTPVPTTAPAPVATQTPAPVQQPTATPIPQSTATPVPASSPSATEPSVAPATVPDVATTDLNPGWNLISFLVLPEDRSIEAVFSSLAGLYSEISTIHNGEAVSYVPGRPGNTLTEITPDHGYWVRMSADATLVTVGTAVPGRTEIELSEGWNLVPYLIDETWPVRLALSSIAGKYDEVRGFDTEAVSFFPALPAAFNTLHELEAGRGYLIHMNQPGVLAYP